jgi:hypothetical protein
MSSETGSDERHSETLWSKVRDHIDQSIRELCYDPSFETIELEWVSGDGERVVPYRLLLIRVWNNRGGAEKLVFIIMHARRLIVEKQACIICLSSQQRKKRPLICH